MIEVTVRKRRTLVSVLRNGDYNSALLGGFAYGRNGIPLRYLDEEIARVRAKRGFAPVVADLLTPPSANAKLDAATVPTYGLTLAHATLHEEFNLCPWSGDCEKVCVLNTGKGMYDNVRRAWLWRTDMFAYSPVYAVMRMGWELGRAVRKHGQILFRPDVNSDLTWHTFLPSLGSLNGVKVYGYTKSPAHPHLNDRRVSQGFYYAYSHNESSDRDDERSLLMGGGKVAVVTSRRKGEPVDEAKVREFFGVDDTVRVVDADVSDEWMFAEGGVVGDLSAKGSARRLIGVSEFVMS